MGIAIALCIAFPSFASAAPTVTSISPNNGTYAGGTTVTITGTGFSSASTVNFGSAAATSVTFVSSTKLTAKSPAGGEGALVDVTVKTEGTTSAANPGDQFGYDPTPSGVWLGLNSNSGNIFGYKFQEHNIKYDRSWHLEVNAGTLPTSGSTFREGLENSVNNGMKPIVIINYSSTGIPTGAALTEYVTGFVATAKAARELYPKAEILFEAINEPYFRGGTELAKKYANLIAALLPEAREAGIPLSTIYVAAWGFSGSEEWIPTMYATQPSLKTLIQGWNFHPYGRPGTGTNPDINHGIMNVPTIQAKMTSGQNNVIISEVGFCAEDLGYACTTADQYSHAKTSSEAAAYLSEVLKEGKTMHEEGWLRALLVYSRGDGGWAMVLGTLTAQGNTLVNFGNEQSPTAPLVHSEAGSQVQATAARLNGTVDAEGISTSYSFEWGTTTSYGHSLPVVAEDIGSGIANVAVNQPLVGLEPGTVYHFRVKATNSVGTTYGADKTFETTVFQTPVLSTSFGTFGTENGQFKHPADVARDSEGNLWVVDQMNSRVEEFNSAGQYVTQFGSFGSTEGKFVNPTAIAIAPNGKIWVADRGGHISRFTGKGVYDNFRFGTTGQFSEPEGLAIDASGNIWVSDTEHNRVVEYKENGEQIKVVASLGSKEGQVTWPKGIDIGPGGNVWVVDSGNDRVEEFSSEGTYKAAFGTFGSGNGQLTLPGGIAVDSRGVVWVGDSGDNRVEAYTESGKYLTQFGAKGSGEAQFQLSDTMGLSADAQGQLWITDPGNNRVQKWQVPDSILYSSAFGSSGSEEGHLTHPADLARDSEGNLWVVDKGNNRVEEFNSAGEYLHKSFGSKGTNPGQFTSPTAIAIAPNGKIWVADIGGHIQRFTSKGEYDNFRFGSPGSGTGQFADPEGMAIDSAGNIWVADSENFRVVEFKENGELIKELATGSGAGQVLLPTGIDIGPGGNIWIADSILNRVEEFSSEGTYKNLTFGTSGSGNGQLSSPSGLAVDSRGVIWVADSGNSRVQTFTEAGKYLNQFGSYGSGAGQFQLFPGPSGLALGPAGEAWVTDPGNNRVQRWAR